MSSKSVGLKLLRQMSEISAPMAGVTCSIFI
jgi:hypothetical protein